MYYYRKIWSPPGNNFLEIITGQKRLTSDKLAILLAKVKYTTIIIINQAMFLSL